MILRFLELWSRNGLKEGWGFYSPSANSAFCFITRLIRHGVRGTKLSHSLLDTKGSNALTNCRKILVAPQKKCGSTTPPRFGRFAILLDDLTLNGEYIRKEKRSEQSENTAAHRHGLGG